MTLCISFPIPLLQHWCRAGEEAASSELLTVGCPPLFAQGPPSCLCCPSRATFCWWGLCSGLYPMDLDWECGEGLWEQNCHSLVSPNTPLLLLSVAGFMYSFEMKRSILNQQYLAALRQIAVVFLTNWNTMAPFPHNHFIQCVVPSVSLIFFFLPIFLLAIFACNSSYH